MDQNVYWVSENRIFEALEIGKRYHIQRQVECI